MIYRGFHKIETIIWMKKYTWAICGSVTKDCHGKPSGWADA